MRLRTLFALGAGLLAARRFWQPHHDYSFSGKSVLITGGSRGLGLAIGRILAAEGARLTLLARNGAELERAAADLRGRGAQVLTIAGDVSDQNTAHMAVERAVTQYGGIDVLINNAGIIQVGPLENSTVEDFRATMDVHFWGPLYTTLAARPHMQRRGGGRIVNISSVGGKVAVPHLVPYTSSKHALVGLSDGLHAELASDDIQVTTVCPGLMRTGSHFNALFTGQHEQELAWFTVLGNMPLITNNAEKAAAAVVEACRAGRAHLTIGWQARLLELANALAPNSTSAVVALVNQLLPQPAPNHRHDVQTGWQSRSDKLPDMFEQVVLEDAAELNGLGGRTRAQAEAETPA
jgi:NAD(P)-dependent dehydrogenase (short-subunit alcohol dehydrogenase family)